jgi:hypothetical protein
MCGTNLDGDGINTIRRAKKLDNDQSQYIYREETLMTKINIQTYTLDTPVPTCSRDKTMPDVPPVSSSLAWMTADCLSPFHSARIDIINVNSFVSCHHPEPLIVSLNIMWRTDEIYKDEWDTREA